MAISSGNESSRWWRILAAIAVLVPGSAYFVSTVVPSFSAWFIREDSRFFANGIFSFYDLWSAFATRMNSMGQYRPIIRVFWGAPAWLGFFDPYAYHCVSLMVLVATAGMLARFVFLYFGCAYAALWGGFLFALLPVNGKPLYWLSAWHNSAAVLFITAACVFRVEGRRSARYGGALLVLSLASFFLALASREVAFGVAAVLLAIDWLEERSFRRSWDVAALALAVFAFVFLVESPFRRAGLSLSPTHLLDPAGKLDLFWRYAYAEFWAVSDVLDDVPRGANATATGVALALTALAPLLRMSLGLGTLLAVLGIAPFLLLGSRSVEYGSVMALGIVFVLAGTLSLLDHALPRWARIVPVALAVAALPVLFAGSAEVRKFYARDFVRESGELQAFVGKFRDFSATQPPYRAILITRIDPAAREALAPTMHFLHPGLDELIPDRVFLFTNETIGIIDGIGENNPNHPFWATAMKNALPPIRAEYGPAGFRSAHD